MMPVAEQWSVRIKKQTDEKMRLLWGHVEDLSVIKKTESMLK